MLGVQVTYTPSRTLSCFLRPVKLLVSGVREAVLLFLTLEMRIQDSKFSVPIIHVDEEIFFLPSSSYKVMADAVLYCSVCYGRIIIRIKM